MEAAAYNALRTLQDNHWWFKGRRQVISGLLNRILPSKNNREILEAGCGYGGNIGLLNKFGRVECFEFDGHARDFAAGILGRPVHFGHLPHSPGFEGRTFDLIAMLDVLEHIEEDVESLRTLRAMMAREGRIVITVPAFPFLWSKHDEVHHHKRRYTKQSLDRALREAGFAPLEIGYFNTLLFPLALGQRLAQKMTGRAPPVDRLPPQPINRAFKNIFATERVLVGKIPMPFGLSLYAVAKNARA